MTRRGSATAAAVALLALTGCGAKKEKTITRTVTTTATTASTPATDTTTTSSGGGDVTAYEDKVRVLGTAFQSQVSKTQAKVAGATDNPTRVKVLGEFGREFASLAAKLDAVTPPSQGQSAQDRLVALLRKGAADIKRVQHAIDAKSVTAIRATSAKFQRDALKIQAALQALRTAVG